jgi:riboflavin kinase/FMN adenylyltransferase
MLLIRGLKNLTSYKKASAVTIGCFDGIHIAHQKIISQMIKKSYKLQLNSVLISFNPSPQEFFVKKQSTLTSFREKHELLEKTGLDSHLIIKFDNNFANTKAEDFIVNILINKLNMKYLIVGDDFLFGANKSGNFELLKKFAAKYNFILENKKSILHQDLRVSSSKIRELLLNGDIKSAEKMLGRKFLISGKVIHGEKLGRRIGFPTINISSKNRKIPILGIFAVNVLLKDKVYNGVCSVGTRPTVDGKENLLEVFMFDFASNIYGQRVVVIFKEKIRDEKKFSSIEELKLNIQKDVDIAKLYFNTKQASN